MSEKNIILTARIVSLLFTPFYLPLIGVLALLFFSYLSLFPWQVKVVILALIYLSTLLLPTFLIHLYRKYQGWTPLQMGLKERRMVPYIISILCYFGCYYVVNICHMPHPISSILVVAVLIQVLCAIINVWWKISTHTTGLGGVAGSLLAFAAMFNFDPTWWLCLVLFLAGMVGSSRMILRQHTLTQVVTGFFLGLLCGFFVIIFV
mgnify:FL=1